MYQEECILNPLRCLMQNAREQENKERELEHKEKTTEEDCLCFVRLQINLRLLNNHQVVNSLFVPKHKLLKIII